MREKKKGDVFITDLQDSCKGGKCHLDKNASEIPECQIKNSSSFLRTRKPNQN